MKNFKCIGLMLVFVASLLVSCTSDNVMTSSSQVTNHEVVFSLYEQSISSLDTRAETSGNKTLAECKLFTELEVALIPADGSSKTMLVARQDDSMSTFGKVKMQIPNGTYHLVIIAANTDKPISSDKRIDIKSATEVTFPNNKVTDMAYCYKDITISSTDNTKVVECVLKRAVAAVKLLPTDKTPDDLKTFNVKMSGNIGTKFNPSKGCCTETCEINRVVDVTKIKYEIKEYNLFVVPGAEDVTDAKLETQALNTNGEVLKANSFTGVHLVMGKRTTYKGPFYTFANGFSIYMSDGEIGDSNFGVTFE